LSLNNEIEIAIKASAKKIDEILSEAMANVVRTRNAYADSIGVLLNLAGMELTEYDVRDEVLVFQPEILGRICYDSKLTCPNSISIAHLTDEEIIYQMLNEKYLSKVIEYRDDYNDGDGCFYFILLNSLKKIVKDGF
jgi:hypothetical protein